jgi:hypothetical protein
MTTIRSTNHVHRHLSTTQRALLAVIVGCTAASGAAANLVKITIGLNGTTVANRNGTITAGPGGGMVDITVNEGDTSSDIALRLANALGGNAVAVGNMVTINGAKGGGIASGAGLFNGGYDVDRRVMPAGQVAQAGAKVSVGDDPFDLAGSVGVLRTRIDELPGGWGSGLIDIEIVALELVSDIHQDLFDAFEQAAQDNPLPPGFSFELLDDGVGIFGGTDLFDIDISLEWILEGDPGDLRTQVGVTTPTPGALTLLAAAGLTGAYRRRRSAP